MKGTFYIEADERGVDIESRLEDVSQADKLILLHSVAGALGMDSTEILVFFAMERQGLFSEFGDETKMDISGLIERGLDVDG